MIEFLANNWVWFFVAWAVIVCIPIVHYALTDALKVDDDNFLIVQMILKVVVGVSFIAMFFSFVAALVKHFS